jgi:HEAT repeat protein
MQLCEPTLVARILRRVLAWLFFTFVAAGVVRADEFSADPVDDLRQALRMTDADMLRQNPALRQQVATLKPEDVPAALSKERGRILAEKVQALRRLSDLRGALLLREWRQELEPSAPDPKYRAQVAALLQQGLRNVLKGNDIPAKLAVMAMLSETAISTRTPDERAGSGRPFAKDLVDLALDSPNTKVRQAAAQTLGLIFPDPRIAVPALAQMLSSTNVAERRAAAAGLESLIRVVTQLTTTGKAASKVEATASDLVEAGNAVLPVASRGLADPDLTVRRLSAGALEQTAAGMLGQAPQRISTEDFAETNPALIRTLLPLLSTLGDQAGAMKQALNDPDPQIRVPVRHAFESLITARARVGRFRSLTSPVPLPALPADKNPQGNLARPNGIIAVAGQKKEAEAMDPVEENIRAAVPRLAAGLSDRDLESRLAALDALEVMGPTAAPALPALIRVLGDPNQFIRWQAVRTLGRIGYTENPTVVPALARLLGDPDLDVRLASCVALAEYGPAARAAIPALIQAIRGPTDTELKVAAMSTLQRIGPDSISAIPVLIETLENPDARARQKAAEVLARFGPAATSAIGSLRRALDDDNAEVRRAASEALLNILRAGERR